MKFVLWLRSRVCIRVVCRERYLMMGFGISCGRVGRIVNGLSKENRDI